MPMYTGTFRFLQFFLLVKGADMRQHDFEVSICTINFSVQPWSLLKSSIEFLTDERSAATKALLVEFQLGKIKKPLLLRVVCE
jgi:hypothetical protein